MKNNVPYSARAFERIRAVELAALIADPFIGMLLVDYGAEVMKVEMPPSGDGLRAWGSGKQDVGLYHMVLNRNKRSVTADLHTPHSVETVKRLSRTPGSFDHAGPPLGANNRTILFERGRLSRWRVQNHRLPHLDGKRF